MSKRTGLAALTQPQLEQAVEQARPAWEGGRLPDYIPLLADANPKALAVCVRQREQENVAGDRGYRFPLMSVIKPLLLLYVLEQVGAERVFERVGMDPSDQPFHSVAQLITDRYRPRNPMINSGAIALTGFLSEADGPSRCAALCQWLNQQAGSALSLDEGMLASVRSLGNEANRTIALLLTQMGLLDHTEIALDTYNHLCCLAGTVQDLAQVGMLLALPHPAIQPRSRRIVNALMLTCGLYETSGRYAVRLGLPTKSGVSGALLTTVPGQGAIACYSPAIDLAGNPLAGLALVESLVQTLNLSLFDC